LPTYDILALHTYGPEVVACTFQNPRVAVAIVQRHNDARRKAARQALHRDATSVEYWREVLLNLEIKLREGYQLVTQVATESPRISILDKQGEPILVCDSLEDLVFALHGLWGEL
jgi:hypothetical protein